MQVRSHVEKFARLSALRHRLEPIEDFELWFWTTLTAGTNALNATLHMTGLTSDDRMFSTIPGVHVVPQPDGSYARELRGPGDVSHVGWPPIDGPKPSDLLELEAALERIEQYRDPCLRQGVDPTPEIADECQRSFHVVTGVLVGRFGRSRV